MKTEFRGSFAKDLKGIKDKAVLKQVKEIIEDIEKADSLSRISNLKKLKGHENYYRLRAGNYRLGIALKNDTVISKIRWIPASLLAGGKRPGRTQVGPADAPQLAGG